MSTQKTNKVKSHPLYNTWRALRQRCDRKNHHSYIYYGDRENAGGPDVVPCFVVEYPAGTRARQAIEQVETLVSGVVK